MTDNYPRGKLNESDEGAIEIAVYDKDRTIIIDFGKDISWIGMDKDTAIALAKTIMKHVELMEAI